MSPLQTALNWLDRFQGCRSPYGLGRIERLLADLDHPEREYPSVLIAGTNGKGSVVAMLEAIVEATGTYETGATVSPHLLDVRERVRWRGASIPPEVFVTGVEALAEPVAALRADSGGLGEPSFFELVTALAFWAFREQSIDLALVEIGLGGRLDATNVVTPEVAIITNIGTDHQELLGESRLAIATEKLGILKRKGVVVTGERDPAILALFRERAAEMKGAVIESRLSDEIRVLESTALGHRLAVAGAGECGLRLPGAHQIENLACVVTAIETLRANGFDIPPAAIQAGLERVRWPGRLDWRHHGDPPLPLLLDGAHNREGLAALTAYLERWPMPRPCHLVFGTVQGKPVDEMAAALARHADSLVFVPPASGRAATEALFEQRVRPLDNRWRFTADLATALTSAPSGTASLLVTGSLYLVADYLRLTTPA